ncbi:acetyltransferase [Lacticaseibacillus pantheris DSM 15945 = JCM 12539 = NBRC 106106]|uniref:Acetyltransferase n=1 Tax=Lacticaseibacillus pantheris DSM 15945 = JCM 12539 = NBRC 106106 TaxID=1423783 RepID=A0A0R1TTR3_9LACO|nr:GNAT family N-acetyltransferase [Lacticaseibacillus pantheris]KRL84697.1 acetyltransferase [Lacticaseibacillus pantheris DSM 15945 = JCM 12539 = NBRC 106106]
MEIIVCTQRPSRLIGQLVQLWEGSVRATHHFLDNATILEIKQYVPEALQSVPVLVIARNSSKRPIGFLGTKGDKLEMLFVAAENRGQGIGRQLLQFAIHRFDLHTVIVNEQNPQARGFYEHMGFHTVNRNALDEQGRAYPVLTMRRS